MTSITIYNNYTTLCECIRLPCIITNTNYNNPVTHISILLIKK